MKRIYLLLLLVVFSTLGFAQTTTIPGQVKFKNVPLGSPTDSVLVIGLDGSVRHVKVTSITTPLKSQLATKANADGSNAIGNWNINAHSSTFWGGREADLTSGDWGGDPVTIIGLDMGTQKIMPFDPAAIRAYLSISNVDNTRDAAKAPSLATQTILNAKLNSSEKAVPNGVATLGADGKVPNNQIPALAISETFPVSSQVDMLSITGADQGDVAVRTDVNKSFILRISPASTLANWQELLTPTAAVQSVNGQVGNVTLTKGSLNLGNVDDTSDPNKPVSTATAAALLLKANAANAALTGVPTAPAAAETSNSQTIMNTEFGKRMVSAGRTIGANTTGNAATVTNGLYTTGNQTKNGNLSIKGAFGTTVWDEEVGDSLYFGYDKSQSKFVVKGISYPSSGEFNIGGSLSVGGSILGRSLDLYGPPGSLFVKNLSQGSLGDSLLVHNGSEIKTIPFNTFLTSGGYVSLSENGQIITGSKKFYGYNGENAIRVLNGNDPNGGDGVGISSVGISVGTISASTNVSPGGFSHKSSGFTMNVSFPGALFDSYSLGFPAASGTLIALSSADKAEPVHNTSPGRRGEVRIFGTTRYECIDTDTWVKSSVITSW